MKIELESILEQKEHIRKAMDKLLPDEETWDLISQKSSTELKDFLQGYPKHNNILIRNTIVGSIDPLFSHIPCVEDIQRTMLNPYLMTLLMSLLSSADYGPEFIMNMMKDNMDGTVTVRLFRVRYSGHGYGIDYGFDGSPKPIYVKVAKHGVYRGSFSALWVQIIEQAYVIAYGTKKFNGLEYFDENNSLRDIKLNSHDRKLRSIIEIQFQILTGEKRYKDYYYTDIYDLYDHRKGDYLKKYIGRRPIICFFKDNYEFIDAVDNHPIKIKGNYPYTVIGYKEVDNCPNDNPYAVIDYELDSDYVTIIDSEVCNDVIRNGRTKSKINIKKDDFFSCKASASIFEKYRRTT